MKVLSEKQRDLLVQVRDILAYATANTAAMGLAAADVTPANADYTTASTALANFDAARVSAKALRLAKDERQLLMVQSLRRLQLKAASNPALTAEQRQRMGLEVANSQLKTAVAPVSYTVPLVTVDGTENLKHVLSFREASTPDSRKRPAGVMGVQVWMAVLPKDAPAPLDERAMKIIATVKTSPYEVALSADQAGLNAWYLLRWLDRTGKPGGWSDAMREMIVA
jgi:hypothetical protein